MKPAPEITKLTGGRSTRAIASKLGCDHSYVAHILRGTRTPSVPMLEKMAKLLKMPMQDLHAHLGRIKRLRRAQRLRFVKSL